MAGKAVRFLVIGTGASGKWPSSYSTTYPLAGGLLLEFRFDLLKNIVRF